MLKLIKIAITGGIGSGKTTLLNLLKGYGAYVISADDIVHKLLDPNSDLGRKIIQLLGNEIVKNGKFDRALIANIVFEDRQKLNSLEELIHPLVVKEIEKRYKQAKEENFKLFAVEIPLLFEIGLEKEFDYTVAVIGRSSKESKRSKRQFSVDEKAKRANFIINNSGSIEELKQKANQLIEVIHE